MSSDFGIAPCYAEFSIRHKRSSFCYREQDFGASCAWTGENQTLGSAKLCGLVQNWSLGALLTARKSAVALWGSRYTHLTGKRAELIAARTRSSGAASPAACKSVKLCGVEHGMD